MSATMDEFDDIKPVVTPDELPASDRILWQGPVRQELSLELDAREWQVPEALRQLLGVSLPGLDRCLPRVRGNRF